MLFWKLSIKQNQKEKKLINSFYKNILVKKHHKFLVKNSYYPSFKTNFNLKKKNNHSIFVIGEVYDYYNGSITPFSKGNYSWFVSTGLKSDVECNDVFLHNFYEDKKGKNIIFKIKNFQTKVTNNIKRNVRHLLYYNSNHFFGLQRFLSQSKTTFNLLQQNKTFKYYLDFSYFKKNLNLENILTKSLNFKKFNKSIFGLFS